VEMSQNLYMQPSSCPKTVKVRPCSWDLLPLPAPAMLDRPLASYSLRPLHLGTVCKLGGGSGHRVRSFPHLGLLWRE
jgi:hypothetical protein